MNQNQNLFPLERPRLTAAEIKRAYYLRNKDNEEWRERRRYIARMYYERNKRRINILRRFRYGVARNLRNLPVARYLPYYRQAGNDQGTGNPEANLRTPGGD